MGLFLLFLRRRGVVPFVVPPAAWGRSFCYASVGVGSLLLLCLQGLRVVPFISESLLLLFLQGHGVCFDQCWLFTFSVVLV